jgi:hypothetical protein
MLKVKKSLRKLLTEATQSMQGTLPSEVQRKSGDFFRIPA